jgi:methionyl-tRNA formyltransferase
MYKEFLKNKRVLFFGLKNCSNSTKALKYLNELGCDVTSILGKKRGEPFPKRAFNWKGDFIFSYRCYWLIPENVLNKAKYLSINFHPSIPEFPGSGSCSWALYNSSEVFGLTVHLMNEKYDNGKILKVYKFKIPIDCNLKKLLKMSYIFSLEKFKTYLRYLNKKSINEIEKLKNSTSIYKWGSIPKKIGDLELMRKIDLKMNKKEIEKRIIAFHLQESPMILLVNKKQYKIIEK